MKFPHEFYQFSNTIVCMASNLTINTVLPNLGGKNRADNASRSIEFHNTPDWILGFILWI